MIHDQKDRYASILMFGGPGTGKGTQGLILGQMPNLVHLAMGDIFRALDKSSDLGKEFLSYSTKGLLVPDDFTVRLFRRHVDSKILAGQIDPSYHYLLLDGIPRTQSQVQLLKDVIEVKKIVHLGVKDRQALITRLRGRALKADRPDDADTEVIRKRLNVYDNETKPVLDAYPAQLICHVNGDQPPLAVLRDIADCLVDVVPANI